MKIHTNAKTNEVFNDLNICIVKEEKRRTYYYSDLLVTTSMGAISIQIQFYLERDQSELVDIL